MLGDLPLSRVLINKDANYPWLILVPRRPLLVEIIDLDEEGQIMLTGEIVRVGRALKTVTTCEKLNIAALGNTVRQLHVHVIARFSDDAAGRRPVWDVAPARTYDDVELRKFVASLQREIGTGNAA
jgi:diadenosine tetraphosphate (Ap4A) HIT family hydrolase